MRLRIGTTELLLLVAGLAGLLEQEAVRVISQGEIEPSEIISGICFLFVLIGAGVTVGKNFRIGPVEVALRDQEEEEAEELQVKQRSRRKTAKKKNGGSG